MRIYGIEKEKIIEQVEPIVMNGVSTNPMETDECYKYLGQDENISYVGPINKGRVMKDYTKRMKKGNCLHITNTLLITHLLFLS